MSEIPEIIRMVARALCDARGGECSCLGDDKQAETAIRALRDFEPSDEMLRALIEKGWTAMIDAALKP